MRFKRKIVITILLSFLLIGGITNLAYAMPPPAAFRFFLFRKALTFAGNIYTVVLNIITSPLRFVRGGDIVAYDPSKPGSRCPEGAQYCITISSGKWDSLLLQIKNNVSRIEQFAKKINNISDFYLRPAGTGEMFDIGTPEGKIFWYTGSDFEVTLGGDKTGWGTLIVKGKNVKIDKIERDINFYSNSLGLIVLKDEAGNGGKVTVTSAVKQIQGVAIFAEDSITFQGENCNFKGLLAAPKITLTQYGTYQFYNALTQTPPPGFREAFKMFF